MRYEEHVDGKQRELEEDLLERVFLDALWKWEREKVCQPFADILEVGVLYEHEQSDDAQSDAEEVEWKQDDDSVQEVPLVADDLILLQESLEDQSVVGHEHQV